MKVGSERGEMGQYVDGQGVRKGKTRRGGVREEKRQEKKTRKIKS